MGDLTGMSKFRDTSADAEALRFPVTVDADDVALEAPPIASYIVCSPERRNIPPPTRLGLPATRTSFIVANACCGCSGDTFVRLESRLFSLDCLELGAPRETDPGGWSFGGDSTIVMGTRRRFVGPEAAWFPTFEVRSYSTG